MTIELFDANELVTFLAEHHVAATAVISDDPTVEDDSVKIGGQLEVQVGDTYMMLTNEKPDGIYEGDYRNSYDDIIDDVLAALKGNSFTFSTSPLVCTLNGHTFTAITPAALAIKVRRYIREEGFGASEIGAKFSVRKDLCVVGTLSYNGRYTKRNIPA